MASAPSDPAVVTGRVDAHGRLIAADAPLAQLQVEAGSSLGARLALPQIAAVVRMARELGVSVTRPVTAAGKAQDFDLWVRATVEGDEVALAIEGWRPRPAAAPRLDLVLAAEEDSAVGHDSATGRWAADAELRLTMMAPDLAERLHVDPSEAVGNPLTRYLKLGEEEDGTLPLLAGLAARADFIGQQASARQGDGLVLLLSGEVIRNEAGEFAGFAGRALLPARILSVVAETGGEDGTLSAGLDSALRSPLDRIICAADKIVERSDGPLRSDYANYAIDIAAAGRHLMSVIRTMSEGAAASGRVELMSCVREAISITAASAEERQVEVSNDATGSVVAQGEERGVVQILVNILSNAIRHSPNASAVKLTLGADQNRAWVTVADNGLGIAIADQQRIFERFERLDNDDAGTGLGLAIARRLAQSMGGDISVDSAPGAGARFTLELPSA